MIPIYSWYTKYIKYTIKTIFIPIPSSFINYLNSDGIVLPKNSNVQMLNGRDELSDDEDLNPIQNSLVSIPPNFDELTSLLDNAIQEYNGKVFIKLHTKAPIDSAWINGGTLACHTSGDIYMLLKSSIKITECLENIQNDDKEQVLYLNVRKWANLFPSMEFRCFIYNRNLVGISQRNCSDYFDYLDDEEEKTRIRNLIKNFYELNIQSDFFLDSFVMDVYIDKKEKVWIIDFDQFNHPLVDPLLFTWDELINNDNGNNINNNNNSELSLPSPLILSPPLSTPSSSETLIPFRIVNETQEKFPHQAGATRGPIDLVEIPQAVQLMMSLTNRKTCRVQSVSDDDDDNDEDEN